MASYQRGETVILTISITDSAGAAASPTTSMVIRIKDPHGTRQVEDSAMTEDATGSYHYDYAIASDADLGEWQAEYIATDSGRVTIQTDSFTVIARKA